MKKPSRIVGLILLLSLFGYAGFKISKGNQVAGGRKAQDPVVKVERPDVSEMVKTLSFTGDILPYRQVNIYSKVTGALESIKADAGSIVREGQELARIDTSELAQQALQTAATYQNAKIAYSRSQSLFDSKMVSKQELDNAEAALAVAKAAFESARLRVDYASIIAPFPGIVTKRFLDAGSLVNANSTQLFSVMDYETVKLRIEVSEKETPLILKGIGAVITVDAYPGQWFEGEVVRRSESIDLNSRTMSIEIEIPNRDHRLKPGMFATATVTLDTHANALTLPANVIQKDDAGSFVWKYSGGTSNKLRVETGIEHPTRVEITSGLTAADSIITLGIQSLREGGKVSLGGAGGSGAGKGKGGQGANKEGR